MNKNLQITLYVVAAYLTVFGVLFLFAPVIAEKVLNNALPDKALNMLYGQLSLTFAYTAFLAARGGDGLAKLSRVILALTTGHVVVFGFQLATGVLNFSQAGPPLIINAIFTVLLFLFRKDVQG
ncbi:MAG: hypothetical protein DCC59_17595 [Chloroflexi bacterium]|nr:hypothetical protein [Anaerolineales bacterium]RIK45871.1 MAG: hypothetical protein DCC59_17595 [Chloroflexota bacterium]